MSEQKELVNQLTSKIDEYRSSLNDSVDTDLRDCIEMIQDRIEKIQVLTTSLNDCNFIYESDFFTKQLLDMIDDYSEDAIERCKSVISNISFESEDK